MSLRALATDDFNKIISKDFGVDIIVTDPNGVAATIVGYSTDIAQIIDPDTGEVISGRLASVALSLRKLKEAGLDIPISISDSSSNVWTVSFDDPDLQSYKFRIKSTNPDRAIGVVTCELGLYND